MEERCRVPDNSVRRPRGPVHRVSDIGEDDSPRVRLPAVFVAVFERDRERVHVVGWGVVKRWSSGWSSEWLAGWLEALSVVCTVW